MQDDSELLEKVLNVQAVNGRLVSRRRIMINGIVYEPASYILQHVGPEPVKQ